ncbi:MAG: O-antigen ligase family protein [Microbacterium sp.]|uniref:O-antigen ligase family protein n=1 Tax=Microbacterium sp. TaxID=51671 RepID=UPI003A864A00
MAVHSSHAVSRLPTAPVRESTGHLLLRAYGTFVVFTAFAGSAWNNLLGPLGLAALVGLLAVVSVLVWALPRRRRRVDAAARLFEWRRLPWFVVLYAGWALASLIWTHWLDATLLTWAVLAGTTLQGLFLASMLTWREIARTIASALKWVLGLSVLFELWAALVSGPLLPNFVDAPDGFPKELYWTRALLFEGGRIQGIVGNANLLGMAALMAIIVFAIRIASVPQRGWLIAWVVVAAYLFVRAASVTAVLCGAAVMLVLATALLMRTARRPGQRTRWYVLYAVVGIGGAVALWFSRATVFGLVGRDGDLTGREGIWAAVLERAWQHPVVGWGYSTPWLPWEPDFAGWIIDHDLTVFMAHSVWVDMFFQLGFIGVALMVLVYLSFTWRAWFFAVDRPRWDLKADRPYSALTLLPTLTVTVLLVQGISESRPLMEWGWLLVVLFAFKIKQSPHEGVGPAEQTLAIERGERLEQGA